MDCLEFDCKEACINAVGEGWQTHSVDQWLELLARPVPEDQVPNIYLYNCGISRHKKV